MNVTHKIAILAKEKGFNEECSHCYDVKYKELSKHSQDEWRNSEIENGLGKLNFPMISAPSQTQLQSWLRTTHNIEVFAAVNFYNKKEKLGYYYSLDTFDLIFNIHTGSHNDSQIHAIGDYAIYKTPEEALEAGLEKALTLIP